MNCTLIMGVRLVDRSESAIDVQKVLTQYGCSIRTRLGLHDQDASGVCSPSGILLLQLCCDEQEAKDLEKALQDIKGVTAKLINLA